MNYLSSVSCNFLKVYLLYAGCGNICSINMTTIIAYYVTNLFSSYEGCWHTCLVGTQSILCLNLFQLENNLNILQISTSNNCVCFCVNGTNFLVSLLYTQSSLCLVIGKYIKEYLNITYWLTNIRSLDFIFILNWICHHWLMENWVVVNVQYCCVEQPEILWTLLGVWLFLHATLTQNSILFHKV